MYRFPQTPDDSGTQTFGGHPVTPDIKPLRRPACSCRAGKSEDTFVVATPDFAGTGLPFFSEEELDYLIRWDRRAMIRRYIWRGFLLAIAIASIVLATSIVWGSDLPIPNKIAGPERSLAGDLVVLKINGSVGEDRSWAVDGPGDVDSHYFVVNDKEALVFASRTPGRYLFVLAIGEAGKVSQYKHVLQNGEEGPGPDPIPPGKRWVLILGETKTFTPAQAQTIQGLRRYATAKGHVLSVADPDQVTPDGSTSAWLAGYKAVVSRSGVTLPALVVDSDSSAGGAKEVAGPLPDTSAAAVKAIQDYGG